MVEQITPPTGDNVHHTARQGSPENPYPLHWPAAWYRRAGPGLGFEFSSEEINRGVKNGGVLGVERYEPTDDALVELRIPEGSYVKCYVH